MPPRYGWYGGNQMPKNVKKHELALILGDFNVRIGQGQVEKIVWSFGLNSRNEREERLIQLCTEAQFAITNTYYKLPPGRLSSADTTNNLRIISKEKEQHLRTEGKRHAKKQWMTQEILELVEERRLIKKATARYEKRVPDTIKTKVGKVVIEIEEEFNMWQKYIETEGPEITRSEVEYAIKTAKDGKVLDPDKIPVELLKIIEENCNQLLMAFSNKI
ncbi:hypothetical protein ILUMI_21496 [Ignelater luminosus]|uniref:Endonuclease/exonuclease/phosphatase domain-containing protein n=1 Tax=Ignelater luminosus TaxID=2038154 RepID=A0A8K0G3N8_IGNLU|nr:hypothetical protein ILUMI_21496 [Ignelater luminosus]